MIEYLYHSALKYQKLHGQKPNLVYLNNLHLAFLQQQLASQDNQFNLFTDFEIKIVLSPTLSHPTFASI